MIQLAKILVSCVFLLSTLLLSSAVEAQNQQSCCLGKKKDGQYHIACDQPAMKGMGILQNMRASNITCSPSTYQAITQNLCKGQSTKASSWTTNILGQATSCAELNK